MIPIRVPPLRDRREDIPALVRHFADLFSRENNRRPQRFTPAALEFMQKARWKGNVRELKNTVERLLIMTPGDTIDVDDLRDVVRADVKPAAAPPEARGNDARRARARCASSRNRPSASSWSGSCARTPGTSRRPPK